MTDKTNTTSQSFTPLDQHKGWFGMRFIQVHKAKWKNNRVGFTSSPPATPLTSSVGSDFRLLAPTPMPSTSAVVVAKDTFRVAQDTFTHENYDSMLDSMYLDRTTQKLLTDDELASILDDEKLDDTLVYISVQA